MNAVVNEVTFAVADSKRANASATLLRFGHLVRMCARSIARTAGADPEELWSAGALALLEALPRFDATRGVKIETFLRYRIRCAMLDELRRLDRFPRRLRRRISSARRTRASLANALGRCPTREETADALETDSRALDLLDEVDQPLAPLEAAASVGQGESSADAHLIGKERQAALRAALGSLSERERMVIGLRFVDELVHRQIGSSLGVSEARVCQIQGAALRKLRDILATTDAFAAEVPSVRVPSTSCVPASHAAA